MTQKPETEPFGEVAIKLGFITRRELKSALETQERRIHKGEKRHPIGMIMIEQGLIDTAQLIQILRYYEKKRATSTES